MKTKHLTNLLLLFATITSLQFMFIATANAEYLQNKNDAIKHAVGVLKGIYTDCSKEEAIIVLRNAAINDSIPYAMNALGLAYMEGVGIEKDTIKAIYWLENAGIFGFSDAYHNIGAIYKEGKSGIRQNFEKAYKAFAIGADKGNVVCRYDAGFMLYKGLGCEQDYAKSIKLFKSASDDGHLGAMYMLGLCYRNGYGTGKDENMGMKLLNKAADLGYSAAIEEIYRPNPENYMHDILISDNVTKMIPTNMPRIITNINDTTLLKGYYKGVLIVYDWSGKFILNEKPIQMSVKRERNEIMGQLLICNDTIPFRATIQPDGSLKYKKTYANLEERYTKGGRTNYKLDHAKLDIWENKICGELSLFSLKQREPERPMYMELYSTENLRKDDNTDKYNYITIKPNPFDLQFNAEFMLLESANVIVRIFDKYGVIVWQKKLGNMVRGQHEISISPNLSTGYYVLNISAGKQVLRTIIIKKGSK